MPVALLPIAVESSAACAPAPTATALNSACELLPSAVAKGPACATRPNALAFCALARVARPIAVAPIKLA